MTTLLNGAARIIIVMIGFALWRSTRENTSQPHVPMKGTKAPGS